jgi:formylglycine-generating enzyme required for sulfatase activity
MSAPRTLVRESAAVFVPIRGGDFRMGSDDHYPEEAPSRAAWVADFAIAATPVTNRDYAAFVTATHYRTVAERPLTPAAFPDAPAENLVPGSMVFTGTSGPVDLGHLSQWWAWTPGANWRRPFGVGSTIGNRPEHPVVHVALEDAEAYAEWTGTRLPTEAEWEYAARGGLDGEPFTWGGAAERPGERLANFWHGEFPWRAAPGYGSTAVVGSFPPNGFGLFDMAGNVWEWTADRYREYSASDSADGPACCGPVEPAGDSSAAAAAIERNVIKGGSFLCADSYCQRYRPAARRGQDVDTGMSHVGFRTAISREQKEA